LGNILLPFVSAGKEGFYKPDGMEILDVLDLFSHAQEPHRNLQILLDVEDDAAFRGAIKLGEGKPVSLIASSKCFA
jgi:hypothetical protein